VVIVWIILGVFAVILSVLSLPVVFSVSTFKHSLRLNWSSIVVVDFIFSGEDVDVRVREFFLSKHLKVYIRYYRSRLKRKFRILRRKKKRVLKKRTERKREPIHLTTLARKVIGRVRKFFRFWESFMSHEFSLSLLRFCIKSFHSPLWPFSRLSGEIWFSHPDPVSQAQIFGLSGSVSTGRVRLVPNFTGVNRLEISGRFYPVLLLLFAIRSSIFYPWRTMTEFLVKIQEG